MGEMPFEHKTLTKTVDASLHAPKHAAAELRVTTPGGRFHVRWDEAASATALGQLAFFAELLEISGLFSRWVAGCPLAYTCPNAPAVVDVLGTWLLSILDGQRRYAHVAGLRGDEVAPQILRMNKVISDESLRRASGTEPDWPWRERRRTGCSHGPTDEENGLDGCRAERKHPRSPEHRLDTRCRYHDQTALWPPSRRRGRLKPHQARAA